MKIQLCWGNSLSSWSRNLTEGCGAPGSASAGAGTHLVMDTTSFLTEKNEEHWYPQRIAAVQLLTPCVTHHSFPQQVTLPRDKRNRGDSLCSLPWPALLSPTQLIWGEFPFQIHKINGKIHHQKKATATCSSNLLITLNSAIHQVFGNWFSPSQIDLFSSSALHVFNVPFRRGFQKHLEYVRPGEESNWLCFNSSLCKQSPRFREQVLAKDIYQFRRLAKLVYRKPAKIKITEKQIFLCVVMSITKKNRKENVSKNVVSCHSRWSVIQEFSEFSSQWN